MERHTAEQIAEFLRLLSGEEERVVRDDMIADTLGLTLRTAINELDIAEFISRNQESTIEEARSLVIFRMGVVRLLKLMMTTHERFPYHALTLPRDRQPVQKVARTVRHLGVIQHARRALQTVQTEYSRFQIGDTGRYEIHLPTRLANPEAVESEIDDHFRSEYRRLRDELFSTAEGLKARALIQTLLEENVYVFGGHFIGYDGDPLLDLHFFQTAWTELRNAGDFDSFNELREFGGILFLKYLLAVAFINSLCLKHEAFARTLTRKNPEIKIENTLTISADKAKFVETLMHALNEFGPEFVNYTETNMEEAEQIYEIVSLSRRNIDLLDNPVSAVPAIIEFSNGGIVKFLAGRHRQMEFVLDALRKRYPADYDRNQQTREAAFQKVFEDLLNSSFPRLEMRRNIHIREGRRDLTDIDLVVIDRAFGDLFLIQLKFQDRPGPDFRKQDSRMRRFRKEAEKWLAAVSLWLEKTDDTKLRNTFQIPRDVAISRTRKLVISRHHAWPMRDVEIDDDTAYANWLQLVNSVMLMELQQGDFRTLNGLFTSLRTHIVGASDRYHVDEGEQEFALDNLRFAILQSGGPASRQ